MSLENNRKILIGSIVQAIDKSIILGSVNDEPLNTLSLLVKYFQYCITQYNAGNTDYFNKAQTIYRLISKLRKCSDICDYKNRLVITSYNTPPTIEDNTIELLISNSYQPLPFNEVIFNYSDAENDLISQISVLSIDTHELLNIDNSPAIVNQIYSPSIDFSSRYQNNPGEIFLIQNTGDPCTSNIIAIDEEAYNEVKQTHQVVDVNNGTETVFKTVINDLDEIPNDTIVYIHIDTSSMAVPDQETIRDLALDWWSDFKVNNPDFEGSLVINTVRNDEIDDNYAPGRGGIGTNAITGTNVGTVEAWLANPTHGLLRQSWKEGLGAFADWDTFVEYVKEKSLVVLTFVDETAGEYHGNGIGWNDGSIFQPTATYIDHYTKFITSVRPNLKFFKGVLYPIIRQNSFAYTFLTHAIGAIEATTLTPTEIDLLVGQDVKDYLGPTIMQDWLYDVLPVSNPYSNLDELKNLGWEANFTKHSPASEVLNSEEFAQELNDILTSTEDVQISFMDTITIPSENIGNSTSTNFTVRVRDNNPQQPLWSNEATITVNYTSECEEVPECEGITLDLSTPHKEDYVFSTSDFTLDPNVDKVRIESINVPNGQLKYYNLVIISSHVPFVIPLQDIIDGHLVYAVDSSVQEATTMSLTYTQALTGIDNYCTTPDTIEVTKEANPNTPAQITTEDQNLIIPAGQPSIDTTIQTTVTYTGSGGYDIFWTKQSGPNDVQIVDPTVEDVTIQNFTQGAVYEFKITVITHEDLFISEAISTITVTEELTVDAGSDVIDHTPGSNYTINDASSSGGVPPVTFNWIQTAGTDVIPIADATTLTPTIGPLTNADAYTFEVTATDAESNTATDSMNITVEDVTIPCGQVQQFSHSHQPGRYFTEVQLGTNTGLVNIDYDAGDIPDRFQVMYDGNIVADSLFVGDYLTGDPPDADTALWEGGAGSGMFVGHAYNGIPGYVWNGTDYSPTGDLYNYVVQQSDVAPVGSTAGAGQISFTKNTAEPIAVTVIVHSLPDNTGFSFTVNCPIT